MKTTNLNTPKIFYDSASWKDNTQEDYERVLWFQIDTLVIDSEEEELYFEINLN